MERDEAKLEAKPKRIYCDDDLWNALQSVLRSQGTNVSAWFRKAAREFLDSNQIK